MQELQKGQNRSRTTKNTHLRVIGYVGKLHKSAIYFEKHFNILDRERIFNFETVRYDFHTHFQHRWLKLI